MLEKNEVTNPSPSAMEEYSRWLKHTSMPTDLLDELQRIQSDSTEIEERFYKDLEFGTGGMRGIIGAGTNRLNIYTVRRAAQGFAHYLSKKGEKATQKGVAIAYDSRKYSREFACEMATLLAHTGIKVYLFPDIAPTPLLSFAIRHLQASAGLVLTASHNPPEYNGIKVYNQDGGQITEEDAQSIYAEIQAIGDPLVLPVITGSTDSADERIISIGNEVVEAYCQQVEQLLHQRALIEENGDSLSIVYTPLHGTGVKVIPDLLKRVGFTRVQIVGEQATADPRFPTVKAPNPEEPEAFELALQLASEKQADLIMATDPDADRLGVLVKTGTKYEMVNGNQLGAMLLYYLLGQSVVKGRTIQNGLVLKTIVTSDLGEKIAESYGVETLQTLTGFKYIGEKIEECCSLGSRTFVFGYEESYGYLAGDFVRDKDAVQITVLVAEMALYYQQRGKDLFQVLEEIYSKFGYYREELHSLTVAGKEGREQMEESIANLRKNPPEQLAGYAVSVIEDYELQIKKVMGTGQVEPLFFPKANVIKIILADGSWMTVRPSGTEPKMKVYLSTNSPYNKEQAEEKMSLLQGALPDLIRFS
ncbi:phospho-sugar mutase [Brevibacillus choshinensis]|uniref:phospho-sugar mutase n=1 Tax=Brevibacillus choshinensis TaxID=54911 RepID=UPI002E1A994A|nr:phospho-sugar mutase [Brevibacillus choshinensis]MED4781411.1 phospho-sugar mutase [Brevibacillus choshinensis]